MRKLFVSDVDGTLVSEEKPHLSTELKEAIKLTVDNEDLFVLCSGRPTPNLIDLSKELTEDGIDVEYVAGFNGVEIYDLIKQEYIVDNSLSLEEVQKILDACDSLDLGYMYFDTDWIRTNIPENYWTIRENRFYGKPSNTETIACKSQKVLLVVEEELNYQLQERLKTMLPEFAIFESAPHFIEIVKDGINKSTVIKQLAAIEDVEHQNTYGFGDSGNDVELLKYAGTGVTVENGNQKVKAIADIEIGHVDDYAVADYIKAIYK